MQVTQPQETNYPLPRPDAAGEDLRFSFAMTFSVSRVIERNGFPEFSAPDLERLQAHLSLFLYGPGEVTR